MKKNLGLVLLACLGLTLSGCGDSSSSADAPNQKNQKSAGKSADKSADTETQWQNKAQKYIKINNSILKFLAPRNPEYNARIEAQTKQGNFKEIRTDTHWFSESVVRDLKAAIAAPGNFPPSVDEAAAQLLQAIEKYVPSWRALQEYNKAKKYEDDNGAKGKELIVVYVEGIEALKAATRRFDREVDLIAKEAHRKALERYKKQGKLLEMHTLEALGAAEKIIETFDTADDFKNQAKLDAANAQLATMETSLEGMKAEHAKRKAETPASLPTIDRYESIHGNLVAFAGRYRDARKNPNKFNDAIEKYNDAVGSRNQMR